MYEVFVKYIYHQLFHAFMISVLVELLIVQLCFCLTFQALETSGLLTHVMGLKHH